MSLVDRAKNILLNPKAEWEVIAKEDATPVGLLTGYAAILAGIAAAVGLVVSILFGAAVSGLMGGAQSGAVAAVSVGSAVVSSVVGFILQMLVVFGMGYVVAAIAPSFGGSNDATQGSKLIVYSGTAVWLANIVGSVLLVIPILGWIVAPLLLLGALAYGCYLIYAGVKPLLGVPDDKLAGMTVVTLLVYAMAAVVVWIINFGIGFSIGLAGSMAAAFSM